MRPSSEARKKLFRAIVIAGAGLGAAGCPEHGKSPNPDGRPPDGQIVLVDAAKPPPPDAPTDVILIL